VQQHCDADKADAKGNKLDDLGHALEADALEIMGATMVVRRGQ
jgi:hypothetical protein